MRSPDRRRLLALLALLPALPLALAGCAPAAAGASVGLAAAFDEAGAVWIADGRAYLARAPRFAPEALPVPTPPTDVAWSGGDAWVAFRTPGWVQRVTGRGGVVRVGAVTHLSASRAYREDGSAVAYDGTAANGVTGPIDDAVTGGDGRDYVRQAGRLWRVDPARSLAEERPRAFLAATAAGAVTVDAPTVFLPNDAGAYRLAGGRLERLDAAGGVVSSVPHPPGLVGLGGDRVLTVSREGGLRVFRYDLTEVPR